MNMPVYKVSGRKRVSQLVKWELNPDFCRQPFTLLAGSGASRIVTLGTILAMSFGAGAVDAVGAADASNTGDGTIAMAAPATTSAVKPGVYSVVCTTGGIDGASKFRIEDPEGNHVSTATGGTAHTKHVKFTISGGATDFVEGDKFTVEVNVDLGDVTNKIVAWDPDATDGTERIWGISLNDVTAPDGEDAHNGLSLRRDSILFNGEIAWPDGISAADKEAAIVTLENQRMLVR